MKAKQGKARQGSDIEIEDDEAEHEGGGGSVPVGGAEYDDRVVDVVPRRLGLPCAVPTIPTS